MFQLLRLLWQDLVALLTNYYRVIRFSQTQPANLKILLLLPHSPLPTYTGAATRRMELIRSAGARSPLRHRQNDRR